MPSFPSAVRRHRTTSPSLLLVSRPQRAPMSAQERTELGPAGSLGRRPSSGAVGPASCLGFTLLSWVQACPLSPPASRDDTGAHPVSSWGHAQGRYLVKPDAWSQRRRSTDSGMACCSFSLAAFTPRLTRFRLKMEQSGTSFPRGSAEPPAEPQSCAVRARRGAGTAAAWAPWPEARPPLPAAPSHEPSRTASPPRPSCLTPRSSSPTLCACLCSIDPDPGHAGGSQRCAINKLTP